MLGLAGESGTGVVEVSVGAPPHHPACGKGPTHDQCARRVKAWNSAQRKDVEHFIKKRQIMIMLATSQVGD